MTGYSDANAGRGLVLVVDDAPDMRELIDELLTDQGYEVVTAASGGHALGLLQERVPDLVITDLLMPGMDGFALRAEMLRRPALAQVPVIVLSSFWQRPSETLDAVDVIGKPLDMDRLLRAVRFATTTEQQSRGAGSVDEGAGAGPASGDRPTARTHGRTRDASRVQQEA
jgi:CheY-like chemotaxis protein